MIYNKTKIITTIITIIPATILTMSLISDNKHAFAEQEAMILITNNLLQTVFFDNMKEHNLELDFFHERYDLPPVAQNLIAVKQEDSTKHISLTLEYYIVEKGSNKMNKFGFKNSDTLSDVTCFATSFGDLQIDYECDESTKKSIISPK
ncbi:MAG: hypothetical protein ACPKPY_00650 [Nitrososphaeraceae archaeon]